MHLQARHAHEEARAAESLLLLMVAQNVADVLAEEALDAFSELLDPVEISLEHLPLYAFPRREGRDLPVHFVIPGDVRDEVLDDREGLHRPDRDGLVQRQRVHARLAGQARAAVDLGRAGAALARLAVPAHGE